MNIPPTSNHPVSRRALAKGVTWAAPALVVATATPAIATSLRKDPGLNGWVLNSPTPRGNCRHDLEVDSTVTNRQTPDGAPFGLYLYDVESNATVTDAKITYWIIGSQSATWTTLSNHSTCWGNPVRGNPAAKADGLTYTPYTWSYTCSINAANQTVGADGVRRLFLGDFHVRASFTQPSNSCNDVTYWTQRTVTIDRDGPGGRYQPETLTFERRNGTRGSFNTGAARSIEGPVEGDAAPALS